ncbi:hypothetical protein BFJ68_g156 [Fusarium oxysporum]|uniref:Uncharacterized protein n=2 Tax=Fusarium oxysporum TaxID=5507 RepID=A0A420S8F2_FUSOX|nr:hypothetical protein BFJ65_g11880 [Fusarium oxysporum f. sp. cepae]RKK53599.1 hypothetical protein BFJ66_g5056 [Fusarium oxysporum f. sp. cepae]RKK61783.1 hypothetical protein BFJ67_g1654 [Fusarium oxysporum f. sp. cepae]RKL25518.1 hypothetical protein BFJ68_g156 [Fusarium oxysporum]
MASAGASAFKSPKIPRRPKTPETRQVHFGSQTKPDTSASASTSASAAFNEGITSYTTANSPSGGFSAGINGVTAPSTARATTTTTATRATTSAPEEKGSNQPTNFPALGLGPNAQPQWHISADPTQSLAQQVPTGFVSPTPQQHQFLSPQFHPAPFINAGQNQLTPSPITYIGIGPQSPAVNTANMGDYQNTAPPVHGMNFQPPVPDTTFGPMQHVYVPRFDNGLAGVPVGGYAGVQVCAPSFSYVAPTAPLLSPVPMTTPACTTVVVPKTFYLNGYTYYQPAIGGMAPQPTVQGSYVVQQQPYYYQQPNMGQQPVLIASHQPQQFMPQVQQVAGVPSVGVAGGAAVPGTVPVFAGNVPGGQHVPDVTGVGRTAGEEQLRQIQFAHANKMYEPQDFKPADDDPSRFYYVREVDGNWTQRNRFTIDHMGDSRWYVTDEGWFYAVRLPN